MRDSPENGIAKFLKDNIFQILGFAVLVGNLWLASQLAPLTSDVKVLSIRVQAVENTQDQMLTKAEFNAHFEALKSNLNQVNEKLDRLLLK